MKCQCSTDAWLQGPGMDWLGDHTHSGGSIYVWCCEYQLTDGIKVKAYAIMCVLT